MNNEEWLQQLKAGDEVFIFHSGYNQNYEKAQVAKVTKTHIVIDHGSYSSRFKRDTGRVVGGSAWHTKKIVKPAPNIREKIELDILTSKARSLVVNLKLPTDRATLEALISTLAPFVK
jgi:predicted RNA-binding protein with PUA-like domain